MTELRKAPIGMHAKVFIPNLGVEGVVVAAGKFLMGRTSETAELLIVAEPLATDESNIVIIANCDGYGNYACRNERLLADFVWAVDDPLLTTIQAVREAGYLVTKKAT